MHRAAGCTTRGDEDSESSTTVKYANLRGGGAPLPEKTILFLHVVDNNRTRVSREGGGGAEVKVCSAASRLSSATSLPSRAYVPERVPPGLVRERGGEKCWAAPPEYPPEG